MEVHGREVQDTTINVDYVVYIICILRQLHGPRGQWEGFGSSFFRRGLLFTSVSPGALGFGGLIPERWND